MRFVAILAACCLVLVGCSDTKPPQPATAPPLDQQMDASNTAPSADQQPVATEPVTPKVLAKDKQEYELAKLGYTKDPASKTAKDTYVFTTVRYGLAKMDSGNTELPNVKYPGALRLFREALKIDPQNEDAQRNKDLIESIYKQLKRPIPQ